MKSNPEYVSRREQMKREPKKDRVCNLCGKTFPMTKFQRFCGKSECNRKLRHLIENEGELSHHYKIGN